MLLPSQYTLASQELTSLQCFLSKARRTVCPRSLTAAAGPSSAGREHAGTSLEESLDVSSGLWWSHTVAEILQGPLQVSPSNNRNLRSTVTPHRAPHVVVLGGGLDTARYSGTSPYIPKVPFTTLPPQSHAAPGTAAHTFPRAPPPLASQASLQLPGTPPTRRRVGSLGLQHVKAWRSVRKYKLE
jgi:hypothetical protein